MGFVRQEYWGGLPFPHPGDLPDSGIESVSPVASALAGRFFTTEPLGKPLHLQCIATVNILPENVPCLSIRFEESNALVDLL